MRHSLPADAETADALLLAMRRLRARTPPSYARAARLVRAATQTAARRRLEGTLRFAHADLPLPPLPLPSPGSPEDGQGGAGGEAEAVQRARAQRGRFSLGVDAADVLKERSPAAAAAAAAPETGGALPWFVVDCRAGSKATNANAALPRRVAVDARALRDSEVSDPELSHLTSLSGFAHLSVVADSPDSADMLAVMLQKRGLPYVGVVRGGYAALAEEAGRVAGVIVGTSPQSSPHT
ncbi:hypothetical protein, partial [Brevundimonas sp.]|uniref:hypothetical protein n=1 Tax=Brevundimonas sp. TaxID=1871086 RepID=UPI00391D7F4A